MLKRVKIIFEKLPIIKREKDNIPNSGSEIDIGGVGDEHSRCAKVSELGEHFGRLDQREDEQILRLEVAM